MLTTNCKLRRAKAPYITNEKNLIRMTKIVAFALARVSQLFVETVAASTQNTAEMRKVGMKVYELGPPHMLHENGSRGAGANRCIILSGRGK